MPIDLAQVVKLWGPLPGVAEVRDQTGTWNRPETSRQTWFTDSSEADERLTEIAEGHGFAYELSGFTNVLAKLTSGVRGEWSFLPMAPARRSGGPTTSGHCQAAAGSSRGRSNRSGSATCALHSPGW
ncbi:hypothetical protein [Streptomyces sp. NPDC102476]|uniref:hypothetical protein n=1 Tax=Streptomyces sp. NPDC102476 TaxID=3366181 RepID=UPI00382982DC